MSPNRQLPHQVEVELDLDAAQADGELRRAAAAKLQIPLSDVGGLVVCKRSLDCRAGRIRYHFVLERCAEAGLHYGAPPGVALGSPEPVEPTHDYPVVIVGDGPCGLFCAYELARHGIAATVVERGKRVQPRRRDLRGLTQLGTVDADSNYCFGEGGAGTYSDGKLYTRSHKRGDVRDVIELLARHGAPVEILFEARPHIGSNRLPMVVTSLREHLEQVGVQFLFESRVTELLRAPTGRVGGVRLADGRELEARAVVLATGHSAGDLYAYLHESGLPLEAKPFAVGVRIEHPQPLINSIQYGALAQHAQLPSAAYRLVDSRRQPAVFSFCMCPGGFIVPATTEAGHVVVNGMSPSRRNSRYANSGLVAAVEVEAIQRHFGADSLAGLRLQRALEHAAFEAGGGQLRAPATRLTDFLAGRGSSTVPASSYVPGLTACDIREVLAASHLGLQEALTTSLREFGRKLRGFLSSEAVLVGVETRTSAPLRIPRTPDSLESPHWPGLFPGGEGAGYAGGIVSAAVDGMRIARSLARAAGAT